MVFFRKHDLRTYGLHDTENKCKLHYLVYISVVKGFFRTISLKTNKIVLGVVCFHLNTRLDIPNNVQLDLVN